MPEDGKQKLKEYIKESKKKRDKIDTKMCMKKPLKITIKFLKSLCDALSKICPGSRRKQMLWNLQVLC